MSDTNITGSIASPDVSAQLAAVLMAAAQSLSAPATAAASAPAPVSSTPGTPTPDASSANATGASAQGDTQAPSSPASSAPALSTADAAPQPAASSFSHAGILIPDAWPVAPTATSTDPESLALLRKIDANVTELSTHFADLSTRMSQVEKTAGRKGAGAGAVAGGLSGGIVAAGVMFARAKLGF